MINCHYYWLFEPIKNSVIDSPERKPTFTLNTNFHDSDFEFALLCDPQGSPELARLRIPNLETERVPESVLPLLQVVKEHLLTTLRLVYREDIQFSPLTIWNFFENSKPYELKLRFGFGDSHPVDPELVKNFFSATVDHREEIRLLVDGNDSRIPLQYRFLSFYKIIELEFKSKGHWDHKRLSDRLDKYQSRINQAGLTGLPSSALHRFRDRCAHIKTGIRKQAYGVTELNHKEALQATKLLPILREFCTDIINNKSTSKFKIGDTTPWYERPHVDSQDIQLGGSM